MNRLWAFIGRICHKLSYPVSRFYLKDSHRTRVIVQAGDKILVVKDWLGEGDWKLPGGGIHKQEEPVVSAQRELAEETGIEAPIEQLKALDTISAKSHGVNLTLHVYSYKLPEVIKIKRQRLEIIDTSWLTLDEINSQRISTNTKNIINSFINKL